LSDEHFNPETHELNQAGRVKIAGIFKNNTQQEKAVLVQTTYDPSIADARLNEVRVAIDKWYGTDSFNEIAITHQFPGKASGTRSEIVNQLYGEGTPEPLIPVATGTGSTSNVGN
jgi:hypothetical protein